VGVSQANISYYETGTADPATTVVASIARALGVSTDILLGIKTDRRSKSLDAELDQETSALWKRFKKMRVLPTRDQRAVIRLLTSLANEKQRHGAGATNRG